MYTWTPEKKKHMDVNVMLCTVTALLVLQHRHAVWNDTLEMLEVDFARFSLNKKRQHKGKYFSVSICVKRAQITL